MGKIRERAARLQAWGAMAWPPGAARREGRPLPRSMIPGPDFCGTPYFWRRKYPHVRIRVERPDGRDRWGVGAGRRGPVAHPAGVDCASRGRARAGHRFPPPESFGVGSGPRRSGKHRTHDTLPGGPGLPRTGNRRGGRPLGGRHGRDTAWAGGRVAGAPGDHRGDPAPGMAGEKSCQLVGREGSVRGDFPVYRWGRGLRAGGADGRRGLHDAQRSRPLDRYAQRHPHWDHGTGVPNRVYPVDLPSLPDLGVVPPGKRGLYRDRGFQHGAKGRLPPGGRTPTVGHGGGG